MFNQKQLDDLKQTYCPGFRVRLLHMNQDPYPVPDNTLGTIQHIDDAGQIHVKWDNGQGLALVPQVDQFTLELN